MRKQLFFVFLLTIGISSFGFAQLMVEDFDYTAGSTLDSNGWDVHSGGTTNQIAVGANSLTFPGYAPLSVGGSAVSAGNGQDINKYFGSVVSSGNAYASFLLRVDTIGSTGYFFHLMDSAASTSSYRARTFFQADANNANALNLGLSFSSGTGAFDTTEFLIGDTILVVVKYTVVSGTGNDSVSLFAFDPSSAIGFEPSTPLLGPFVGTSSDIDPARIALRQFNSSSDYTVDAFAVNTSWNLLSYCTASPSSVDGSGITNVTIDTLNNSTGTETGNYGDYTSMIANASQGENLPVSIELSTGYTYDMWAWVDWNNDFDFDDAGEEYFLGTSSSANPTVFTSTIAIPATASVGQHRLRIGGADGGLGTTSPSDPCYTGSYGSFEDYTLNINAAAANDASLTAISNNFTCGIGADSVTVDISNLGTTSITSLPLMISINGGTYASAGTYAGSVAFGSSDSYSFPVTVSGGINTISVVANLTGDADNTNDTIMGSFLKGNTDVLFTLNSGSYGSEKAWALIDSATGAVIDTAGLGTYASNSTTTITYCLDSNSTYIFNAYDQYSDSWDGGTYSFTVCSGVVTLANNGGNSPSGASGFGFGLESTETFTIPGSCPACLSPSALSADSITTTSASLSWTENGTATNWVLEYDTTGFAQGTGTIMAAGTNPVALTGLTSNTTYQFYVQANCGTDSSTWEGPFAFTTNCNAYTIPYFEGFESGYTHNTAVGGCLSQESSVGTQTWTANNTLTSYNRSPYAGSWNAFLRYGNTDWIFIPVDLTGGTSYTAEFYARQDGATAGNSNVMVAFGSSNTAAGMTDTIVSPTGIVNGNYQQIIGSFTPATTGTYYVGIRGFMNFSPWYISLDNMAIYLTPNCPAPNALMASNITASGADLGWTENGSATTWQIEYDTAGFTQGTGTMSVVTANPTTISGLTFETNYEYYVRSICGGTDTSTWSGVGSFYTGYCTASPTSVDGSGIINVSMDTINNTTGAEPGNYGNYSSMVAVAAQGTNFPIDITLSTGFGYTYDMWAWVDWNDDLDFSDPGEEFFLGTSSSAVPTTFSSSIAIPSTAALGNHRIRIGGADSGLGTTSPSDPCYTGSYASFEDYTLNIIALAQIDLTITWDEVSTVDYTTVAFEGGISAAALDPTNSANNVLQFVKPVGAQPWAGVTLSTSAGLANPIPFTASATTVSAQVYSPAAGTTIMMKTEVVGSPTIFVEATATTTAANTWETLVFDFGAPTNGSLNLANTYELLSFFPDFLSAAAGDTFYVDSVYFGGVVPTQDAAVTTFEGLNDTTCISSDTLMIVIENYGNTEISNFDIVGNQNGGGNDTLFYADTIAANGVDTLYFPVDLDPGNNTFNVWTLVSGDVDVTNDSNSTDIFYSALFTSASSVDVTCPESTDGLAAVTIDSGGIAPFTYMWSDVNMTMTNTISGLGVGTYNVTSTDAFGCQFIDTVSIAALNQSPTVSISGKDTICGSETTTLDAGAGFSTYAWGGGETTQTITVNTTGTYMVTITDANGCVNDDSYDIFAYATITLSTSKVDVTCEGGNDGVATGTATGGASGFTYEWNDGSTNSSNIGVETGTYVVTATDAAGCFAVDTVDVDFLFTNPAFSFAQANVAGEASVTVNAGGAFDAYNWSNGTTTASATFTTSGTYSLTVSDTNGCSTSDTITVEIWPLGVNQIEATSMSVYPNPSTGLFNLSLSNVPTDQIEIVVLTLNGQVVTTSSAKASNGIVNDVVDLSNQAAGIYLLQVNINGNVSTLRLNVQ